MSHASRILEQLKMAEDEGIDVDEDRIDELEDEVEGEDDNGN